MSNDASENGLSTGDLCGGEALDNSGATEETQSLLSLFEFAPIGDYLRENLKYPFDMGFFVETQDENEKGRKKNWFYPFVFLAIAGWFLFMSLLCYALFASFRACYRRVRKQPNPRITIDQFRDNPRSPSLSYTTDSEI